MISFLIWNAEVISGQDARVWISSKSLTVGNQPLNQTSKVWHETNVDPRAYIHGSTGLILPLVCNNVIKRGDGHTPH